MNQWDNGMRRQVYSLPDLIEQQYGVLEPRVRELFSFEEIFGLKRIIITGCGDSLAAGMAVKQTFETLTGVPTETVTAIDMARFYPSGRIGGEPYDPLVIAISNSGRVSRISELVQRTRELGGFTLGITGHEDSPLGTVSQKVLKTEIPPFETSPGVRSYLAAMMALQLLAIRIGEVRGRYTMDQAGDYRRDLKNCGALLRECLDTMDSKVFETAVKWKDFRGYDFVAAGSDYAAAWYGHAKILEAAGRYAMFTNTEEWLHLNFFLKDVDSTGTVLVADDENAAFGRAREVLGYMKIMKRPLMVVTDSEELGACGEELVPVPKTRYGMNSCMITFVPLALLAGYISQLNHEPYSRAFRDNWAYAEDVSPIWDSEIEIIR